MYKRNGLNEIYESGKAEVYDSETIAYHYYSQSGWLHERLNKPLRQQNHTSYIQ